MSKLKQCTKCGINKEVSLFYRDKYSSDYLTATCRDCRKYYIKNYRNKNKSKNAAAKKEWMKQYGKRNEIKNNSGIILKTKICSKCKIEKEYFNFYKKLSAPTGLTSHCKNCINNNRKNTGAKRREYIKNRRDKDPIFKLCDNIRRGINISLEKNSSSKKDKTFNYVKLSGKELMDYLEKLFKEGMTRYNQGRGKDKWHVDHIKPLAAFDKTKIGWEYEAWNYINLQPLWEEENLTKHSKYKEN